MGRVLHAGEASGSVLALAEPLSFWGAFDPKEGKIVDIRHPQCGRSLAGQILLLPETRGSGGTPGGIAEALRLGTGPRGIIVIVPDINLAIGAAVAAAIYKVECPVLSVGAEDLSRLARERFLAINREGAISSLPQVSTL